MFGLVSDLVRPEVRGVAYGLASFAEGIAKFPASLLLGLLYQAFGAEIAFGVGGGCAGLACLLLLLLVVPERGRSGTATPAP